MAKYFADGHLRFINGDWRDDNGDVVEISRVRHGYRYFLQYDVNPEIGNWHCSVCNRILLGHGTRERYCPHCGAFLDLEEPR